MNVRSIRGLLIASFAPRAGLLAVALATCAAPGIVRAQVAPAPNAPWQPGMQTQTAPSQAQMPQEPMQRSLVPQPVVPTLERRPADGQPAVAAVNTPPAATMQLPPEEQAKVDRILTLWEQNSARVKTFRCNFKRWSYNTVFGKADQAESEDLGEILYAAPDRGLFHLTRTVVNGAEQDIPPTRAEHWLCDGEAIYEYDYNQKVVTKTPIPPQMRGQAITQSPLPFLFGSKAADLRQRYLIKIITPANAKDETWLQAYPRTQQDARNFSEADLILVNRNMQPRALRIVHPAGNQWAVYELYVSETNDPLWGIKDLGNPFRVHVPSGWQVALGEPQAGPPTNAGVGQAQRPPQR